MCCTLKNSSIPYSYINFKSSIITKPQDLKWKISSTILPKRVADFFNIKELIYCNLKV